MSATTLPNTTLLEAYQAIVAASERALAEPPVVNSPGGGA